MKINLFILCFVFTLNVFAIPFNKLSPIQQKIHSLLCKIVLSETEKIVKLKGNDEKNCYPNLFAIALEITTNNKTYVVLLNISMDNKISFQSGGVRKKEAFENLIETHKQLFPIDVEQNKDPCIARQGKGCLYYWQEKNFYSKYKFCWEDYYGVFFYDINPTNQTKVCYEPICPYKYNSLLESGYKNARNFEDLMYQCLNNYCYARGLTDSEFACINFLETNAEDIIKKIQASLPEETQITHIAFHGFTTRDMCPACYHHINLY